VVSVGTSKPNVVSIFSGIGGVKKKRVERENIGGKLCVNRCAGTRLAFAESALARKNKIFR